MRALARRPTTLERWPKGVHPGIVALDAREGRRRRLLPEARPAGRARTTCETARIEFPSGRHADEICPTEIAVVGWAAQMGTITFHPWPVRGDDVDHPDELRLDLDPQPGTDFADAVRVAARGARRCCGELGYAGFPKTSGGRGVHIYVRIEPRWTFTDVRHAAIAFGRELERRLPGRGDDEVVEGGARRAHLRRLQPERARPHDRLGLQRPAEAGRAGLRAGDVGRAARRRARGLHGRDDAGALRRGRRPPRGDRRRRPLARSRCWTCTSATSRGRGDMPYPPDYPKMPGEPKRVQPSRDRDRPRRRRRYGACGSFFAPRLVDRRRRRRHDRPDVAVRRLVEVDDHRRVVARPLALAGLAVDPRRLARARRPARRPAPGRSASRGPGGTCPAR